MARIKYEDWAPKPEARAILRQADSICMEYRNQGYDLTLRQLYYQFVARALIPNSQESYKRLGSIINKGRMAGLLDWDYIVDRTRNLQGLSHWDSPTEIVEAISRQFRLDKWATQPTRIEVWVEKEALAGVIQRAANAEDVAWFSCRGYVSQSELWGAAQRLGEYIRAGQNVVILHLGDHDPSGIDMTRDIRERLETFVAQDWLNEFPEHFPDDSVRVSDIFSDMRDRLRPRESLVLPEPLVVDRIALNMDQVEEYDPPPNPAKLTDSRGENYVELYGRNSWELDALEPTVLGELIADGIDARRDDQAFEEVESEERLHRTLLAKAARRWPEVVALLGTEEETDG
jgi:hypothetical protein